MNDNIVIVDIDSIELERYMTDESGAGNGGVGGNGVGGGGVGGVGVVGAGVGGGGVGVGGGGVGVGGGGIRGIGKIAEQKDISSFIPNVDESYLPMECRKKIIPYRFYKDVYETMYNKFGYNDGKLSSALNVISLYLKGQKLLYLEAKAYCEHYLYRMMLPAIVISSASELLN